jgi:hypothetical protein
MCHATTSLALTRGRVEGSVAWHALAARASERVHALIIARHHQSHRRPGYSIVGLVIIIFMGRVKVVARQSIGATMSDFLMSKTIYLPSLGTE